MSKYNEVVEEGAEAKPEHHQHKCWNCNTVWEHSNSCDGNAVAHECPSCKKHQGFKYDPEQDRVKARSYPPAQPFWG